MSTHPTRMSAVVLSLAIGSCVACGSARAGDVADSFALVELFTSEGCSSCPPADAVLSALTRDAEQSTRAIYTLSFHVDYWNDLGWRDPFSARWASQHQRAYAAALHDRGVYTPQVVVDGREEFVGSHAAQIRDGIARALSRPRSLRLRLEAARNARALTVHYQLVPAPPEDSVLRLALVEPEASGLVRAGENAGHTLRHVNIVRAYASAALHAARGEVALPWPSEFTPAQRQNASLVGYVQRAETLEVSAAARAVLR